MFDSGKERKETGTGLLVNALELTLTSQLSLLPFSVPKNGKQAFSLSLGSLKDLKVLVLPVP